MANPSDKGITIPGTKTKVPKWAAIALAVAIAAALLFFGKRGGGDVTTEDTTDTNAEPPVGGSLDELMRRIEELMALVLENQTTTTTTPTPTGPGGPSPIPDFSSLEQYPGGEESIWFRGDPGFTPRTTDRPSLSPVGPLRTPTTMTGIPKGTTKTGIPKGPKPVKGAPFGPRYIPMGQPTLRLMPIKSSTTKFGKATTPATPIILHPVQGGR